METASARILFVNLGGARESDYDGRPINGPSQRD
jgi:hypothetical protein